MKKKIFSFLLVLVMMIGIPTTAANGYTVTTYNNGFSSYNRTAAREYAAKWVNSYNTSSYADFTSLGGDCTNFVSQCIRAGEITFTSRVSSPTYNHWYYYNSTWGTGRTSSWTSAHEFRKHFAAVNGTGAKRSYQFRKYSAYELAYDDAAWKNLFNNIGAGDVVQYTSISSGETLHSQIVHRKSQNESYTGEYKVSMAQHTLNGWKNLRDYARNYASSNGSSTRWVTVTRFNASTTW